MNLKNRVYNTDGHERDLHHITHVCFYTEQTLAPWNRRTYVFMTAAAAILGEAQVVALVTP